MSEEKKAEGLVRLGVGGMAVVYLARNENDAVAVKVIREDKHLPWVARETKILRIITQSGIHPNVIGHRGEGPGIVMTEYIYGESLEEVLERRGTLSPDEAAQVATQICAGLACVHGHRIIHRDLKPENILIAGDEKTPIQERVVKIIDFGLAKQHGDERLTDPGTVTGTLGYMSPEQAEGKMELDVRTDLFALGCLLYRMLTGVLPFEGADNNEIFWKTKSSRPGKSPDPRIPQQFWELIRKLLEFDREERPASAEEVGMELAAIRGEMLQGPSLAQKTGAGAEIASPQATTAFHASLAPMRKEGKDSARGLRVNPLLLAIIPSLGLMAAIIALLVIRPRQVLIQVATPSPVMHEIRRPETPSETPREAPTTEVNRSPVPCQARYNRGFLCTEGLSLGDREVPDRSEWRRMTRKQKWRLCRHWGETDLDLTPLGSEFCNHVRY